MISTLTLGIALSLASICFTTGVQAGSLHRRLLDDSCAVTYGQCGGITCPNGQTTCSDSAYSCCPADFSCQRQNQWYWQCLPGGDSNPPPAAPTQTPAATSPPSGSPFAPVAYESHVATVPASQCQVVDSNANYPNGLQCQGSLSFPACCSGAECNVYQYWNANWINRAWSSQSPGAGLAGSDGACFQNFLLGCCPPLPN